MYNVCKKSILVTLAFLFGSATIAFSQEACTNFIINNIEIVGNEKTKSWIIAFESELTKGDTIPVQSILAKLETAKSNLKRTRLFSSVEIKYILNVEKACFLDLVIVLRENWLLFPTIILETVDRNFNVWWNEFNHDTKRLNYGFGVAHYNLTGRSDKLKIKLARGYSEKYELQFERMYLTRKKNIELGLQTSYIESQEAPYGLAVGKLQFFSIAGKNSITRYSIYNNLNIYSNRRSRFSFSQDFSRVNILDTISDLYPDFLLDGSNKQSSYRLSINYKFSNLNDPIFPNSGWHFIAENKTTFLRTNQNHIYNRISISIIKAAKVTKKIRYQGVIQSQVSINRAKQPFNSYQGVGSENVSLEGYEYYFIPGADLALMSHGIYLKIFDFSRSFFKIIRNEPIIKMDFATELLFKVGAAYVNDPFYSTTNTLANQSLGSISSGLQISINSILKLEANYSVNHLGQGGVYFVTKKSF